MNRKIMPLLVLIWVNIYLIESYILVSKEFADVFLYSDAYAVIKMIYSGHLYLKEAVYAYHPFYDFILYILSIFSNKPPELSILLPIGLMILPISYFVLVRRVLSILAFKIGNNQRHFLAIVSYFSLIYLMIDGSIAPELYNTFAYAWAYTLYLTTVLVLLLFIIDKRNQKVLITLPVIYATLMNIHYTSPLWLIIILAILLSLSIIKQNKCTTRYTSYILAIYGILYLMFNKIFYDVFLLSVKTSTESEEFLTDPIRMFIEKVSGFLYGKKVIAAYSGFYIPPYSHPLFGKLRVILYLMIAMSIFLLIVHAIIKRQLFKRYYTITQKTVFALMYIGFFTTFAFDSFGYSIVGTYSTKYLLLMGPLIMITSLWISYQLSIKEDIINYKKFGLIDKILNNIVSIIRIKIRRNTQILIVYLIIATIINGISLSIHITSMNPIGYSNVFPSSKFFYMHLTTNNTIVLTDIKTYCMYLPESARYNVKLNQRFINEGYYNQLVNPNPHSKYSYDYFISSPKYRYLLVERWMTYKPITMYSSQILSNDKINKIYDDSTIWIFHVSKR